MKPLVYLTILATLILAQHALGQHQPGEPADSVSLAESYLNRMSVKKKKERQIIGGITMAVGVATSVYGLSLRDGDNHGLVLSEEDFSAAFFAMGVILIAGGTFILALPSQPEKKQKGDDQCSIPEIRHFPT